jgi:hypothetical protein
MTAMEATVEIAKAALSIGTGGPIYSPIQIIIDETVRGRFVQGISDIYKTFEQLSPKPEIKQP